MRLSGQSGIKEHSCAATTNAHRAFLHLRRMEGKFSYPSEEISVGKMLPFPLSFTLSDAAPLLALILCISCCNKIVLSLATYCFRINFC
jgi:hypothetical protein